MASFYELSDWRYEFFRYRRLRPVVWSYARGETLELGVGTGLNIPYYPIGAEITAIDFSPRMLEKAKRRAARIGRRVRLHLMDVTDLRFEAASFDCAVATFLFCVLPDEIQPKALSEIERVLKPGGRLILLDYVYSQKRWRRLGMRLMAPIVQWLYGARFDRRTSDFLREGGWHILEDRFVWQDTLCLTIAEKP